VKLAGKVQSDPSGRGLNSDYNLTQSTDWIGALLAQRFAHRGVVQVMENIEKTCSESDRHQDGQLDAIQRE